MPGLDLQIDDRVFEQRVADFVQFHDGDLVVHRAIANCRNVDLIHVLLRIVEVGIDVGLNAQLGSFDSGVHGEVLQGLFASGQGDNGHDGFLKF